MKVSNATPKVKTDFKTALENRFNPKDLKAMGKEFVSLSRGGTMNRDLFIANAFVFLLGTRLLTSRDKDEKREIKIRDIPTIIIAVVGVPIIQNFFEKPIQNKLGFGFMEKGSKPGLIATIANGIFKGPKEGAVSYGKLEDWYVFNKEKTATGFEGFTKRLEDRGGNLKKIFSSFGGEIKEKIDTMFGKDKKVIDNETFRKTLNGSPEGKKVLSLVEEAFKQEKNAAFKQASWARTIPTLLGFGITLALIGLCIPGLNIAITERVNKKRKAEELAAKQSQGVQEAPKAEQAPVETNLIKQYKK